MVMAVEREVEAICWSIGGGGGGGGSCNGIGGGGDMLVAVTF